MWVNARCAWIGTGTGSSLASKIVEPGGHVDNLSTVFREGIRANVRTVHVLIPFSTTTTVTLNLLLSLSLNNVDSMTTSL